MNGYKIKSQAKRILSRNWRLYVLMIPAFLWLILFAYMPMYGLTIAFKDFKVKKGILESPWAEPLFKHFTSFFSTSAGIQAIQNTVILSVLTIVFAFPLPIVFALLLNQIKGKRKKKFVQTVSFAPHFVSNVVVVSIVSIICAPSGFVNTIIQFFNGGVPLYLTSQAEYFRMMYIVTHIWQTLGFSSIAYTAALAGISPDYHEAAVIDGASKMQRIRYIDIPLIMPTVIILLILQVGGIMSVGYEKVYLMQAGTNTSVSEILSTYVYKIGLLSSQFSFATAVGLFNSVVNFILLLVTNKIAKKVSDISLF